MEDLNDPPWTIKDPMLIHSEETLPYRVHAIITYPVTQLITNAWALTSAAVFLFSGRECVESWAKKSPFIHACRHQRLPNRCNRSGLIGYRSNRSGPVPVWAGTKPAQIQILNLNLKK